MGVVYFSIIPTFEPSRYCKCWIVCFYDKKFELLWRKLQQEKLVKHSLEEIENSDLFKYSPYKELNDSQRKAVEDILAQIESGNVNRVVVNGMPGSGKTIVAVYLMKYLADSEEFAGKKIGFVVPQM